MSRTWAISLVAIAFLSIGVLAGGLIMPRTVEAAREAPKATAPRLAYVNVAKVLREFTQANVNGQKITRKRQEFVEDAKRLRDELQRLTAEAQAAADPNRKETLQNDARQIKRKLEDIEAHAQKTLTDLTNQTIVEVYQNIKDTIAEVAKERGLDVVEIYPDASNPKEELTPAVAQVKLQSPALTPIFIREEFVITDVVIARLNEKFAGDNKGPGK